jgi:diguanylate cyclase (GGDEF)-like protein/PAS domain S-box-containing protein
LTPLVRSSENRTETLQGAVIAAAVVVLLVLGLVAKLSIDKDYRSETGDIFSDIERTTQKLASHTTEVFDRVDQTLLMVRFLDASKHPPALSTLADAGLLAGEMVRCVALTNARGIVVDTSAEGLGVDLSGDPGFRRLQAVATDNEAIIGQTAPTALAGGAAMIPVMRRIERPDKAFGGVVVAMVDPATLSSQNLKTESAGTAIGVIGLDGVGRMRLSAGHLSYGGRVDVAMIKARAVRVRETLSPAISAVDQAPRFVGNVSVERYPLLAVIAIDARDALADYRRARTQTLSWASLVAAMILLGAALLWRRVREVEIARDRTQRTEAALRATLEGSMDAVSVLRAQRARDGTIADMVIVDTNARAAALNGTTREQVLGASLCSLRPSIRSEGYLARFETVIQSGQAADFESQAMDGKMRGRWLHHQMVPVGDDGIALISRDVSELREAAQALAALARIDPLTRLGNRREFEARLREARARAARSEQSLALVNIDLDGFKAVNDTHGHAAGDQVLVAVAERLVDSVRTTDTVCRLGGDEFVVILENAGTVGDVADLCERVLVSLSVPHLIAARQVLCTPSIGAALLRPFETLDALAQRADAAMYASKQAGKSRCSVDAEFEGSAQAAPDHAPRESDRRLRPA